MARIGSYPIDAVIHDKDAWIGTENTNRVTRQFTAKGIAEYIDTKNVGLVFVGATALVDGKKGLVPAPVAGQEGMYLKGDLGGGWTTIPVYTLDVPAGTTNVNLINTDGAGAIINSFITLTGGTYLTSVHTSGSQITFNHDNTTRSDTTSTVSPAAGASVPLVASVTSNATGHVTAIDVKTVTWPADSDTTYTIDVPNATTSINLAGSDGTNDPIAFTTVAGNNGMTISRTDANTLNFNSKWQINNVNQDGYVPKGQANANKFWATDGNGNPGWTFQPSQDQTLTSTGTTNASTGIVLSQNGGTVIVKGDGSTISASSNNTTNTITLAAINRVNTTYTLPVAAGAANTAVINLTDNSAVVSSVTFNGTANKIAISETVGNNGDITIGMPDDVTVTGELTVSGTGQSSFGGQVTIPQTPTADTDAASKKYVDDLVSGGLTFRGTFNAATGEILSGVSSGSQLYNCPGGAGTRIAVAVGDYYIVATAGGSFYCSGATLDIGDSIIATAAANADASVVTGWSVVQSDEGVASFTNANGTFVSAGTVNSNATGAVTMGTIDLSATGTKDGTTFLRGDNTWAVPAYVSYSAMTTSTLGLGKIKYDFGSTPAAESQSTTASRTYGITKNASDQLVVNVPWLNSSDVNSVTASGATTALSGLSSTPNTGSVVIGLDIHGRASLGAPASDDELMIYDTSTAKNVKVLVSDLASYAGSAATNQVTYWTSANEIGGAAGFTFAGGANGAVTMGGTLTVAGDSIFGGTVIEDPNSLARKIEIAAASPVGLILNDTRDTHPITVANEGAVLNLKYNTTSMLALDGATSNATFAGNVGIGTTPNAKLEVASGQAKTATSGVEFARFGTSNEASNYATLTCEVKGGAAASDRKWIFQTIESGVANAGNIIFQPSGGNVGIGTDSPDALLELEKSASGAVGPTLLLNNNAGGGGDKGNIIFASYGTTYQRAKIEFKVSSETDSPGNIDFYTGRSDLGTLTQKMTILGSGNVGIGTATPYAYDTTSTKLHVKNEGSSGSLSEVARFEGSADADGSGGTIRLGTSNDRGIYFEGGRTGSVPYGKIGTTEYDGSKTLAITLNNSGNSIFAGTNKATTFLINRTTPAGIGASLGDINGAELGPGYLSLSRDDTASAKQIVFEKNDVEHTAIITDDSDFIIDSAKDISLDAGGNDIRLKVNGVEYGKFKDDSDDLAMFSSIQDKDILFKGNDGGSTITALTLDMSNGGSATFRDDIDMGGSLNMTGSSKVIKLNGGGYIDFDSTNLQFNTQRNPNTGAFNDVNKSHASIGLQGADGGSQIVFGTAAANNTTATSRYIINKTGSFTNTLSSVNGTTYIGYDAGLSSAATSHNTFFGYYAGRSNTGTRNVIMGSQAAYQGTNTMNYNVIIGYNAAKTATNASDSNVIIGDGAMSASSGAGGTVIIGQAAGVNNTRNYLVAIGNQAGYSQTDAAANTRIGYNSGYHCTVGNYNTSVGYQSMQENTDQSSSTAIGYRAQYYHTSGSENVYIGYKAGFSTSASTAYENTIIGSNAAGGNNNLSGAANTALGRYTMFDLSSGTSNTALGHQAMLSLTSGDANTGVGKNSLSEVEGGSRNTGLGTGSGQKITSGSDNIAIGYESLYNQLTNGQTIAIGINALYTFTGSRVVAIGYNAGKLLSSDVDNVFIGQQAGENRTAGIDNTFVGAYANYAGGTGCCNTGVGKSAGYSLTSGVQNTFLGRQAGYSITTTNDNTMIGHNAGILSTGTANTYVGSYAGDASNQSGYSNTGIGRAALSAVTSGFEHTTLGKDAGDEITTGSNCMALGFAAGSGSSPRQMTTNSNEIVLGNNSITGLYCKVGSITTSDKRDKGKFEDIKLGLDFVNKLKPTAFEFKIEGRRDTEETDGIKRYGFLAQEVLQLEGENPVIIDNSDKDKLCYKESNLIPILVNAIQELKAEIEILKNK